MTLRNDRPTLYYINMDRSSARRRYMEETLAGLKIDAIRITGVDGQYISDQDRDRFNPPNNRFRPLSKAEIGCLRSHRACWEEIIKGAADWAIILEDDLAFAHDAKDFLDNTNWLPDQPGLVRLEAFSYRDVLVSPSGRRRLQNDRYLERLYSECLGTGAYAIHKATAQALLATNDPIVLTVDRQIMNPQHPENADIAYWHLNPAICIQQHKIKVQFMPDDAELSNTLTLDQIMAHRQIGKVHPAVRKIRRPIRRGAKFLNNLRLAVWADRRNITITFRR